MCVFVCALTVDWIREGCVCNLGYYLCSSCALGSISSLGMGWKGGDTAAGVLYTLPALLLSISLHPPPGDLQIAPITVSLACL